MHERWGAKEEIQKTPEQQAKEKELDLASDRVKARAEETLSKRIEQTQSKQESKSMSSSGPDPIQSQPPPPPGPPPGAPADLLSSSEGELVRDDDFESFLKEHHDMLGDTIMLTALSGLTEVFTPDSELFSIIGGQRNTVSAFYNYVKDCNISEEVVRNMLTVKAKKLKASVLRGVSRQI